MSKARKKPLLEIYTVTETPLTVYRVLDASTLRPLATTTKESEIKSIVDKYVRYTPVRVDSFTHVVFEDVTFGTYTGLIHNCGDYCPKTVDYGG